MEPQISPILNVDSFLSFDIVVEFVAADAVFGMAVFIDEGIIVGIGVDFVFSALKESCFNIS